MPNLLLTTTCNRKCPYCFAIDAMEDFAKQQMDFDELIMIADLLEAAGRGNTGILGGEPTLHPQFVDMVAYLNSRGISTKVFTNGICGDNLMDDIDARLDKRLVKFVVNVNFPEIESQTNRDRQEAFMKRFAPICDLGVNIFRPDLDPIFLKEVAERARLANRTIRVGFAQPIVGEKNRFLQLDAYREVAGKLVRLAEAVFPMGLVVVFDCGFPLCSFTDEQLGKLRRCRAETKFVCQQATDIAPTLKAWSCFPLTKFTVVQLERYQSLRELMDEFNRRIDEFREQYQPGIFEECRDCLYRKQMVCHGGCMAHVVTRTHTDRTN